MGGRGRRSWLRSWLSWLRTGNEEAPPEAETPKSCHFLMTCFHIHVYVCIHIHTYVSVRVGMKRPVGAEVASRCESVREHRSVTCHRSPPSYLPPLLHRRESNVSKSNSIINQMSEIHPPVAPNPAPSTDDPTAPILPAPSTGSLSRLTPSARKFGMLATF